MFSEHLCMCTGQHGREWQTRDRRDMPAHMKGGLAWLAWVGFEETRENAPARPKMVTIDGLEPAEHAAPAYNMCAGPRWLEHSRRLSMAARQTLHRGHASMHGLSTLQHMVLLEEACTTLWMRL